MTSEQLTCERLRKKFKNNFDLCNFAIQVGRTSLLGGSQATLTEIIDDVNERASESPQANK
ncbi:MAG: hypothetical protein RL235_120 [Chlamydiota bacterium]|jgi:hypothetical protein